MQLNISNSMKILKITTIFLFDFVKNKKKV